MKISGTQKLIESVNKIKENIDVWWNGKRIELPRSEENPFGGFKMVGGNKKKVAGLTLSALVFGALVANTSVINNTLPDTNSIEKLNNSERVESVSKLKTNINVEEILNNLQKSANIKQRLKNNGG